MENSVTPKLLFFPSPFLHYQNLSFFAQKTQSYLSHLLLSLRTTHRDSVCHIVLFGRSALNVGEERIHFNANYSGRCCLQMRLLCVCVCGIKMRGRESEKREELLLNCL